MSGFSNYAEKALLDHLFGKGSYTVPTIYVTLLTAAPTDASTGTTIASDEADYTSYVRVATVAGDWNAATAGDPTSLTNAAAIEFAQSTGGSSIVTHFALVDASTAGNMLAWGALNTSKTIDVGDTPSFAIGSLTVTLN